MKGKTIVGLSLCLLLCGCSSSEVPKLLEPVGESTDSAKVIQGELYNIASYDLTVTSEYSEIKLRNDGIIKNVNVQIGDTIRAGTPIVTLDQEAAGSQLSDIDTRIAELEADYAYLNQIDEYDIQILECEIQNLKESEGSYINEVQAKTKEIRDKRAQLEKTKIQQQKEIAELQLSKTDGGTADGEVTAPFDGTVVYLNVEPGGAVVESGTVVAVIVKKDSKILFGDYIENEIVEQAHQIYARIGNKDYHVTNVPYEQSELNRRLFYKLPLYSTFYIEEAPEVTQGMCASVIVISDYVENALQIPENALLSDNEGYYVYKIKGEELVRQNVSIGQMTETAVEITEGLKEGDEVYVKP